MRMGTAIDDFFTAIERVQAAYGDMIFTYVAVRRNERFVCIQSRMYFNIGVAQRMLGGFNSQNVRAGQFRISELYPSGRDAVDKLISGKFITPDGEIDFPATDQGDYQKTFIPFHPDGLRSQNRLNVLQINGGHQEMNIQQPDLDWELKASSPPYDSLQDLMVDYLLGPIRSGVVTFEAIAPNVAIVDFESPVSGTKAQPIIRLAEELARDKVSLGYRIVSQGSVVKRAVIAGTQMIWTRSGSVPQVHQGKSEIEIPDAAVLHCIASYDGIAQHYAWLSDPSNVQNPRRAVYQAFDQKLEVLTDFITKAPGKGGARDLETGVAWLLWMLGFSVAHLGSTARTQDAADLIVTTPAGHFAVVECTTGLLRTENKLPLLVARTAEVRKRLQMSSNNHLRVLAIMVTSRSRDEIAADLEQAERLGVLVMTRETLEEAVNRTLILASAEALYEQAEEAVRTARAKFDPADSA